MDTPMDAGAVERRQGELGERVDEALARVIEPIVVRLAPLGSGFRPPICGKSTRDWRRWGTSEAPSRYPTANRRAGRTRYAGFRVREM